MLLSKVKFHTQLLKMGIDLKPDHLEGGGEEPSVSRGFFWPTEVFLGVLALFPAGVDAVREPS